MKKLFLFFYNFIENQIHLKRIKFFFINNIFFEKPVIVDIGAHQGKISKIFNSIYRKSRIYCIEPNKKQNKYLKKVGKNIKIFNYAIGKKSEKLDFYINKIDLTNSLSKLNTKSIYLKSKNFILKNEENPPSKKINVKTLDSLCNEKKINKIDILKIDVEGHEYDVLLGSKKIIKNVNVILIEIQKNKMYKNYSQKKIYKFLKKNNFELIHSFNFPLMFFKDCVFKKKLISS